MRAKLLLGLAAATPLMLAQDKPATDRLVRMKVEQAVEAGVVAGHAGGAFHYIAEAGFGGSLVKNAPYTAEATSETTRVLADGTRIVNKNTTVLARDKDGRTRREMNLQNVGPFSNNSEQAPRMVTIFDPVSNEVINLNVNEKTAFKAVAGKPAFFRSESGGVPGGKGGSEHRFEVHIRHSETVDPTNAPRRDMAYAPATQAVMVAPPVAVPDGATFRRFNQDNMKREDLGTQVMEGVNVTGARETVTIPAGEIGNDRPIQSVTERWYSPELQMLIYSKTSDPQFGETVYRITNLRREDPPADLFKIPSDYKLEDGPRIQMLKRKLEESRQNKE